MGDELRTPETSRQGLQTSSDYQDSWDGKHLQYQSEIFHLGNLVKLQEIEKKNTEC